MEAMGGREGMLEQITWCWGGGKWEMSNTPPNLGFAHITAILASTMVALLLCIAGLLVLLRWEESVAQN